MFDAGPATGVSLLLAPDAVLALVPEVLLVNVTVTVQLPAAGMVIPEMAR